MVNASKSLVQSGGCNSMRKAISWAPALRRAARDVLHRGVADHPRRGPALR